MFNSKLHGMFEAVHNQVLDDHVSKGHDYESDEVKFTDSYPNEYAVFLQVQRKFCRLKALIGDPTKGKSREPKHESIADNARDLASFATWLSAWAELEKHNGEKKDSKGT